MRAVNSSLVLLICHRTRLMMAKTSSAKARAVNVPNSEPEVLDRAPGPALLGFVHSDDSAHIGRVRPRKEIGPFRMLTLRTLLALLAGLS